MSTVPVDFGRLDEVIDDRTRAILEVRQENGAVRRRGWLMRRALLMSDVTGLLIAFFCAEAIYLHAPRAGRLGLGGEMVVFLAALPIWVVFAKLYGLYARDDERADHSTADDVIGVIHLVTLGVWGLFIFAYLTRIADPQLPKLIAFWAVAIVGIPLVRGVARTRCRRSIYYLQNTVILGGGRVGQEIARKLLRHPEYGANLVGFVDDQPRERGVGLEHLSLLGGMSDVIEIVSLLDVERLIVAFSNEDDADVLDLVRELNAMNVQVDVVPRYYEVTSSSVDVHSIEGLPLVGLRPPRLSRSDALLKRVLDVGAAAGGLLVLAPVFAVVAIAVKLDSPGPVFFRQLRMGAGGRSFRIFKFRTMTVDAEARKAGLAVLNKHLETDPRMFKIEHDPRVTRVGRLLRRLSLDELPQLFNVVTGDMSLVGPRPLILEEDRFVERWGRRRLDLRPGITGLWQVLGRSDITFDEMIRLDYLYVTAWSLGNDIRLILRTLPALFGSDRAH